MGPRYANSPRTSRNTRNADHEDQRSTIKNILSRVDSLMLNFARMMGIRKHYVKFFEPSVNQGKHYVKFFEPSVNQGDSKHRDQDGKGTGKGTGKGNRKPNRKSDKPTRGGGGGGGGGDDSSVDTHDRGCLRCGERHAVRDCPHSAEDSRKAFKAFRVLNDHSGHKSNAGKAAETDSGSESDDDDQDDEDEKDIQIALISIQMRKSMKTGGFSKKAIERKIKKFEEGMYTK